MRAQLPRRRLGKQTLARRIPDEWGIRKVFRLIKPRTEGSVCQNRPPKSNRDCRRQVKLDHLPRLKSGPPDHQVVCGPWARLRRASLGGRGWLGCSSGRRSGACGSCVACRFGRSAGGRGCIARRSVGRSQAVSRRSTSREGRGSKVDPFKAEIARLPGEDCDLPGVRVGELLVPLGWDGGRRSSAAPAAAGLRA